jgi:hypothetical protein
MKKKLTIVLMLFLLSACATLKISKALKKYSISGKAALNKIPQPGIDVYAYEAQAMLDFSKPGHTAKTDDAGLYSIRFSKEGYYYITAMTMKEDSGEVDLYAFYGRNPVFVTYEGVSDVNLNLQKIKGGIRFKKSDQTKINAILTHKGKALTGAVVYVAVDLNEGMQTKGFAQSDPSDENGECFINVDKGTYYLTARKRLKDMFGPMSEGDLIGFFHQNPIVINDTGTYTIDIELFEIPKKVAADSQNSSKTMITGTVRDEAGNALQGVWVCVYKNPQMFGKPILVSDKTDAYGEYTLELQKGDKYYLAARDTLGGPPAPGDLYGQYEGSDDHSLTIETGAIVTQIDISARQMW